MKHEKMNSGCVAGSSSGGGGVGRSTQSSSTANGASTSLRLERTARGREDAMAEDVEMIEIPSTGLEFFEYRRRLFLAGLPLPPSPITPSASSFSSSSSSAGPGGPSPTIRIPKYLPPPKPAPLRESVTSTAVKRLEELLQDEGNEEMQDTWDRGVGQVARHLHAGKKLARGLRLGLVIKILKASWIQDGLWPVDSTGRPIKPPDSPIIEGIDLFPTAEDRVQAQAQDYDQVQTLDQTQPQPNVDGEGNLNGHGLNGQTQKGNTNGLVPISVLEIVEVDEKRKDEK
ncbi:hypothetical protein IAT40_006296 [Kwoniella sp. CBS 6097]